MKPKAVLFDMDGTLLDTVRDIGEAANRALLEMGFPVHSIEAYKFFVGEGARKLVERALPQESLDKATIDDCLQRFVTSYEELWNVHTTLYPGISNLLDELAALRVRCAILSNKPHEFTNKAAQYYLSRWTFEFIVGFSDQTPHKPDPTGALGIVEGMNLTPAECLFVGDTKTDMETASRAGIKPIGVLWGFRPRKELEAGGAEELIAEPLQLLNRFKSG